MLSWPSTLCMMAHGRVRSCCRVTMTVRRPSRSWSRKPARCAELAQNVVSDGIWQGQKLLQGDSDCEDTEQKREQEGSKVRWICSVAWEAGRCPNAWRIGLNHLRRCRHRLQQDSVPAVDVAAIFGPRVIQAAACLGTCSGMASSRHACHMHESGVWVSSMTGKPRHTRPHPFIS